MIKQVFTRRNAALRVKITVKTLISLGIIALAVILRSLYISHSARPAAYNGCQCICPQ